MGLNSYPLRELPIDASTTGNNIIIAATPGVVLQVYRIFFVISAVMNVTAQDGSTVLTGPMPMLANGSFTLDFDTEPWFTTSAGNAFILHTDAPGRLAGRVYYTAVTP